MKKPEQFILETILDRTRSAMDAVQLQIESGHPTAEVRRCHSEMKSVHAGILALIQLREDEP